MSKALVILRKGTRLTANKNRCLYERFDKIEEIFTPSARSLVPDEAKLFFPRVRMQLEHGYGYPGPQAPPGHVILTADEPFLLRQLAYWAGQRWDHDTRSEDLVKILFTPNIAAKGEPADCGWEIV